MLRLRRHLVISTTSALAIALAGALVTSKLYWGYFFSPPAVMPRIAAAERYVRLTLFKSVPEFGRTATALVRDDDREPESVLSGLREHRYDLTHLAVLEEVDRRGQLRALPPMEPDELGALLEVINGSGALTHPSPGYEDNQFLGGLALEAEESDGTRLLYVAAGGGESSNDHYPRYQLLFEMAPGASLHLVASTHYFVDIAGVEGLEWPVLFVGYALPLLLLFTAAALGVAWIHARAQGPGEPNPSN